MIIKTNKVFANKIQLRLSVSLCKYFGDGIKSGFGLKNLEFCEITYSCWIRGKGVFPTKLGTTESLLGVWFRK